MEIDTTIDNNYLTLKWGTLKSWKFESPIAHELLKEYEEIGCSMSAAMQHDAPRQKAIIHELIDLCDSEFVYLNWDGKYVSKQEAKDYVTNYGKEKI